MKRHPGLVNRSEYNGRVISNIQRGHPHQVCQNLNERDSACSPVATDRTGPGSRLWLGWGAGIVLLTFGLRLWGLTATSLWYDETFVLHHARRGLMPALTGLLRDDNAIPLHGLLVALWGQVAGWTEFAVRYLSVLLGTLAVPLIYRLARALGSRYVSGLGSALAYATLPIFVYYSQEMRMYALAIPLAAAFAWAGWRLVAQESKRDAVAYVVLGWLMLLAHLYTGLVWAVVALWGTLVKVCTRALGAHKEARRLQRSARWWVANLSLALLAAPVVIWAWWRAGADATAVSAIPLGVLRWLPLLFGVGQYMHSPWPTLFAAASALAILGALVLTARTQRWRTVLWYGLSLTVPLILLFMTTLVKAKWSERYLLSSWGLALVLAVGNGWELLLAQPVGAQWRRRLQRFVAVVLIILWLGPGLVALARQADGSWAVALRDEWHPRPDFRGATAYIMEHDVPKDAVVVVGGYAVSTLDYYYAGPAHVFGLPLATQVLDTIRVVDLQALDTLERETEGRDRLWLVLWQDHLADPTSLVQSVLVERCRRLPVDASFINVGLLLFDLSDCRPLNHLVHPPVPLEVTFEAPIRLLGYDLRRTGPTWEVNLWWESTGIVTEDYTTFVHLIGPDGDLIAQHDRIAGADTYPTRTWQTGTRLRDRFFLDVPGGNCEECRLRVGLYTETDRLPLQGGGDAVDIAVP